jgi:hypothetical protein
VLAAITSTKMPFEDQQLQPMPCCRRPSQPNADVDRAEIYSGRVTVQGVVPLNHIACLMRRLPVPCSARLGCIKPALCHSGSHRDGQTVTRSCLQQLRQLRYVDQPHGAPSAMQPIMLSGSNAWSLRHLACCQGSVAQLASSGIIDGVTLTGRQPHHTLALQINSKTPGSIKQSDGALATRSAQLYCIPVIKGHHQIPA